MRPGPQRGHLDYCYFEVGGIDASQCPLDGTHGSKNLAGTEMDPPVERFQSFATGVALRRGSSLPSGLAAHRRVNPYAAPGSDERDLHGTERGILASNRECFAANTTLCAFGPESR